MGKILDAFVREELRLEPFTDFDSEETKNARKYASQLEERFCKTLTGDQQALYSQLADAQDQEDDLYSTGRVIFGYRLGVLMTMEVFTDMDKLFSQEGMA